MKRYLAPILIGLIGVAILLRLGFWQVDRLGQKEAELALIEATIYGEPQPLPRLMDPETQRYLPTALDGTLEDGALYVLVSAKMRGAGWRVISPFQTEEGRRVLVDRGFLPVDQKDAPLYTGPAHISANLHWPDDRNSSTPDNDEAKNIWYARDLGPMSEALQTEPLLVVARQIDPAPTSVQPMPVDTSAIPNDHLQYAITWFSLAAVWLIMTGVWIRRIAKGTD
ncbi:surfeit locus 1 family protein [Sagittula marina]|uniref:SURF1-like protein n=1 Tax=Sagittula marina TaxID=943940 RepID=A0A7W6GSZ6_9RHOB|nr:SURF1 family protein [Sagittula marina]MBB3984634.1 surfeit locus 1 family protein [Sagittula marina]